MELTSETAGLSLSIFIAGFLCTQYLSHVLTLDSLLVFVTSTWLFLFPRDTLATLFPYTPIDDLHQYLAMQMLWPLLVPALVWFLSTDPTDVTIRTALAVSRLVGFTLAACFTFLEQRFGEVFSPVGFCAVFFTQSTLVVVYIVHLFYNSRINAHINYGNLNAHLNLDLMLSTLVALLCVFWPGRLAFIFSQELNWLHLYLVRQSGFLTLGMVCLEWIAPRFRSVANKRAVLFSRALTMLMMLVNTFGKYRSGYIPEGLSSKLMIAALILLTLPSAIGSMRYDHGSGWDLPWRGLRVPDVQIGQGSPADFYHVRKDLDKRRKRARSRGRSRGRRR